MTNAFEAVFTADCPCGTEATWHQTTTVLVENGLTYSRHVFEIDCDACHP